VSCLQLDNLRSTSILSESVWIQSLTRVLHWVAHRVQQSVRLEEYRGFGVGSNHDPIVTVLGDAQAGTDEELLDVLSQLQAVEIA
jgi:hypothetical protein